MWLELWLGYEEPLKLLVSEIYLSPIEVVPVGMWETRSVFQALVGNLRVVPTPFRMVYFPYWSYRVGASLVANLLSGGNGEVDLDLIRSKVAAAKMLSKLGTAHHYWSDAELALSRDALPDLAEVLTFNQTTVQIVEINGTATARG